MSENVPGDKRLPLVSATCRCGYQGNSRYPQTYKCSACFFGARAASNRAKAKKLRKRADQFEAEADESDSLSNILRWGQNSPNG